MERGGVQVGGAAQPVVGKMRPHSAAVVRRGRHATDQCDHPRSTGAPTTFDATRTRGTLLATAAGHRRGAPVRDLQPVVPIGRAQRKGEARRDDEEARQHVDGAPHG